MKLEYNKGRVWSLFLFILLLYLAICHASNTKRVASCFSLLTTVAFLKSIEWLKWMACWATADLSGCKLRIADSCWLMRVARLFLVWPIYTIEQLRHVSLYTTPVVDKRLGLGLGKGSRLPILAGEITIFFKFNNFTNY